MKNRSEKSDRLKDTVLLERKLSILDKVFFDKLKQKKVFFGVLVSRLQRFCNFYPVFFFRF